MKVEEVVRSTGVKRRQAFRLAALAKPFLARYQQGSIAFDPREQRLGRVFRKGICEVLSCCLDFTPIHLRDIARLSGLPLSTAQLASKLLFRQGIVEEKKSDKYLKGLDRLLGISDRYLTSIPDLEWAVALRKLVSSAKEWCHAVIASSPTHILFIIKNACLQGKPLQKLLAVPTPNLADRLLTDRNSWLSIGLELIKDRSPTSSPIAQTVRRSVFGIPLIGSKPHPWDLFDAVTESTPIDPERMDRWLHMGYILGRGDGKVFTQKGIRMVRYRYSRIGLMKTTRIETPQGSWKLVLV
jgi:hypothetical protein